MAKAILSFFFYFISMGALTLKNYMFVARPWELSNVETVDLLDSLGSSIRVDFL
jgi:NADH-quinone oxidoreductase subunit G